jgi:hypothetical protein
MSSPLDGAAAQAARPYLSTARGAKTATMSAHQRMAATARPAVGPPSSNWRTALTVAVEGLVVGVGAQRARQVVRQHEGAGGKGEEHGERQRRGSGRLRALGSQPEER